MGESFFCLFLGGIFVVSLGGRGVVRRFFFFWGGGDAMGGGGRLSYFVFDPETECVCL